jgi:hypothetical protein
MSGRPPVVVVALALVVAAVGGRFAVHTLQAARQGEARDFAILYTAAHLHRQGVSFYEPDMSNREGINRNAALVAEARRLGTLHAHGDLWHIHQFSYPPFAVLPFLPFTVLSWRHAVMLWQGLSVALLAAAFFWTIRAAGLGAAPALLLAAVFLTGEPLQNSMGLGQINQLVLALVALFAWSTAMERPLLGGVALGVATALRFHPALFIAWLAWRRQWRACGAAAATAAACTVLATLIVGAPATLEYATRVAPQYGYATVSGALGNLSLTGWLVATGHGLLPGVAPGAWRALGLLVSLGVLGAAALALRPPGRVVVSRLVPELALLSLVLLLVVPNTTINHLVFTLLPLAVLLDATLRGPAWGRAAALATALVLIGAIDDYYQHPSLTTGPAVLLAGIKTYGLVILTALTAASLRVPAAATETAPAQVGQLTGATRV